MHLHPHSSASPLCGKLLWGRTGLCVPALSSTFWNPLHVKALLSFAVLTRTWWLCLHRGCSPLGPGVMSQSVQTVQCFLQQAVGCSQQVKEALRLAP